MSRAPAETKSVGRNGRCSFPLQTNDSESRYVPEERGRERERERGREAGKVTLRRKDSLSMQKNVVNTTEFFVSRVASWGHTATASSFPQHLETQRMRERKTENVMEMSPLKSFPECLFLSCSIIPSLSLSLSLSHPNMHPTHQHRVLRCCQKGTLPPSRRGRGHWLRRRMYVATLHSHYRLYSPPFVWVSKSLSLSQI